MLSSVFNVIGQLGPLALGVLMGTLYILMVGGPDELQTVMEIEKLDLTRVLIDPIELEHQSLIRLFNSSFSIADSVQYLRELREIDALRSAMIAKLNLNPLLLDSDILSEAIRQHRIAFDSVAKDYLINRMNKIHVTEHF